MQQKPAKTKTFGLGRSSIRASFALSSLIAALLIFGVAAPQLGQTYLCSTGIYDLEQNGQVIGMGSLGTSLITSRVTSWVTTRVPPPPPIKTFPPPYPPLPEKLLLPEGFEEDDFDEEDDLDEELLLDEEPDSPFILPSAKNKTATITTAAIVTNTMMAVSRRARGMLYNS